MTAPERRDRAVAGIQGDAAGVLGEDLLDAGPEPFDGQPAAGHLDVAVDDDRLPVGRPDRHERAARQRGDPGSVLIAAIAAATATSTALPRRAPPRARPRADRTRRRDGQPSLHAGILPPRTGTCPEAATTVAATGSVRMHDALAGIIAGTGFYDLDALQDPSEETVRRRSVTRASPTGRHGIPVVFLTRHGAGHSVPPHLVNYRANVRALADLGVRDVVAVNVTGSIDPDLRPGDLLCLDDFLDLTRQRPVTFFDGSGPEGSCTPTSSSPTTRRSGARP